MVKRIPTREQLEAFSLAVSEHNIADAPCILVAMWLGASADDFERRRRIAMIQSAHSTQH